MPCLRSASRCALPTKPRPIIAARKLCIRRRKEAEKQRSLQESCRTSDFQKSEPERDTVNLLREPLPSVVEVGRTLPNFCVLPGRADDRERTLQISDQVISILNAHRQ